MESRYRAEKETSVTETPFKDAPFSIEKATGDIRVKSSTFVIRRAMPKTDFLDSDLYQHVVSDKTWTRDRKLGHLFLVSFRDPQFENVSLRFFFEDDRLDQIDLYWGPKVTIPEWTKERVKADVERYRSFLVAELGSIETFPHVTPWGRVYAAEDQKAGAPRMGIRYGDSGSRKR